MGGGKKSKHKNLYKTASKSPVHKNITSEILGRSSGAGSSEVGKKDGVHSSKEAWMGEAKKSKPGDHSGQSEFVSNAIKEELKPSLNNSESDDTDTLAKVEVMSTDNLVDETEDSPAIFDDKKGGSQKKHAWGKTIVDETEDSLAIFDDKKGSSQKKHAWGKTTVDETEDSPAIFDDKKGSSQKKHAWGKTSAPFDHSEMKNEHKETKDYQSSYSNKKYQESYSHETSRDYSSNSHQNWRGHSGNHNKETKDYKSQGRDSTSSAFLSNQSSHSNKTYQKDHSSKSTSHSKESYSAEDQPRSRDRSSDSHQNRRGHSGNQNRSKNPEFEYWELKIRGTKLEDTNVTERFGDLFCAPDDYALAHCVAEDMNMGSGIAMQFRSIFKRVDELLEQRVSQGGVAILHVDNRYIYYLVTKRVSSGKPTYETLFRSLLRMKEHVVENNVTKIAMPRIGCGLDRLEWEDVKSMLQYIFDKVNVELVVYNFQQESAPPPLAPRKKCPVVNVLKPIVEIESYTTIIFPCSAQLHVTKEMEVLANKFFKVVSTYKNARRELGSVIRIDVGNNYLIYGAVVKEKHEDLLNYAHFQKCIEQINKANKKDRYEYMAMEGFEEKRDHLMVSKLVNLMRNTFYNVYVYICWPKDLAHLAPRDADYS